MMGLGQRAGDFASVGWPDTMTWEDYTGISSDNPFVAGPNVGGFANSGDVGLVRIAAGNNTGPEMTGHQAFSDLWNFRHSPMPYLALLAIAYFGLVHLQVYGRVGRR